MIFAHPYLLILAPAIGAIYFVHRKSSPSVRYPQVASLKLIPRSWRLRLRKPLLTLFSAIFLAGLALAAARPFVVQTIDIPERRRNIMLSIDVSGSMKERDFVSGYGRTNRLEAVKYVLAQFIASRAKDRIGLVVFGTNAYLQSPLTSDHAFLLEMVKRLEVGMVGQDTAMGDGIGLALKRIQEMESGTKTVVLLTDGVNHTGQVNPIKAANIAKDLGIKIHTVGIGSEGGSLLGRQVAEFDEETLKKIAEISGGIYYHASTLQGLEQVYSEIDKLESSEESDPPKEARDELFPDFLYAALAGYLCLLVFSRQLFLKLP